jgi:DNA-binding transcriptional ArsR family regulator
VAKPSFGVAQTQHSTNKVFLDKSALFLYNHFVMEQIGYEQSDISLDTTFAALADPTRRAILARLARGEASVTDLAEPFAMSQPAISRHLKVLERAGLISRGRDAQRRPRRLEARPLRDANQWLENYRQFWEMQFGRLDTLLQDLQGSTKSEIYKARINNPRATGKRKKSH